MIFTTIRCDDNKPEEADDSKGVERVPERKRPDDSTRHLLTMKMKVYKEEIKQIKNK